MYYTFYVLYTIFYTLQQGAWIENWGEAQMRPGHFNHKNFTDKENTDNSIPEGDSTIIKKR